MNTKNPEISILMPVYNGGRYLKESIDSILSQTFTNFELLIINDGSSDNSENIIKQYDDPRINLINNGKNIGLIKTLNKGLNMAQGKYIARMDQDDISAPERLRIQYNFLENNQDIILVGGWAEIINEIGKKSREKKLPINYFEIKYNLIFRNPFIHSTIFFRKDIVKRLGGYNINYEHAEDFQLYTELSKKYKIVNLSKFLVKFRVHRKSIGGTSNSKKIQDKTVKRIIFNNINHYYTITHEDFEKFYPSIINININFKYFIKILIINRKIYQNFINKEKLNSKDNKRIKIIYRKKNKIIIKNKIKSIIKKILKK